MKSSIIKTISAFILIYVLLMSFSLVASADLPDPTIAVYETSGGASFTILLPEQRHMLHRQIVFTHIQTPLSLLVFHNRSMQYSHPTLRV